MKITQLNKADYLNFEIKFLTTLTIVSAIACFLAILGNIAANLDLLMFFMPGLLGLTFLGFYYWAKTGKKVFALKIIYTLMTLIILNLIWAANNASHGPIPFLFIIFYGVLTFIWSGKEQLVVTLAFLLNILYLFYFDYTYPDFIPNYDSESNRIIDIYTSVIIFGIVIYALMTNAKKNLMVQYVEAKRADMLKSAFLANMSHEIRTPMNAIYGFSQILKDSSFTDTEKKQYIDLICNQTDYLLSIVNELIDISKIESGVLDLHDDIADLNEIILNMQNSLNHLKKKDVNIKLVLDEKLTDSKIIIDSIRLKQVINNLMSNALKYTFNGYVELGYQFLDNGYIQVYVKDTGIGISAEDSEKIFDRFYQIESKNKTVLNEGTGLGLPIASALVKRMGGDLWLESVENEGSIFIFTIPYKPADIDKTPQGISKFKKVTDFKGGNILVVNHQKINYLFLKQVLSNINCKITWKSNIKEAIKFLKKNKGVDLVLIDYDMPTKDIFATIKTIKQLRQSTPIIAQSIFADDDKISKIKESGCDDYLIKPIIIDQLKRMLLKYVPN